MKAKTLTAAAAAIVPAALAAQSTASEDRPNIVVIVADDLLSSELSCNGGVNIHTPNIDRIASEGISFSHIYASEAMSVPIRASMYTGLYPARNGSFCNHKDTFLGTKTVNEYMPEEGYKVGRTGKDHPITKDVYFFDEIPGFTVGCTDKRAPYTTDGIRRWVTECGDNPFLLYVCSINPHAPWTWGDPSEFDPDKLVMPENCVDSPDMRKIFCKYLAEVRQLDNEVGSVLEMLEQTGKLDDTIVMFLGEQGPQFPGGKWTLWNPGVHSTLVARYPKAIKAGSKTDAIIQYEDLLPTFIDIAGGKARAELDGVSFKDALFGKTNKVREYAYGIHNNVPEGTPYPIRSIRDDRYALLINLIPEAKYYEKHLMRADGGPTSVWPAWLASAKQNERSQELIDRYVTRPEVEFYDLKKDPWEMNNLAGKKKYAKKIAQMRSELEKWMEQQGDTGADMDREYHNRAEIVQQKLAKHDKAVVVKDGWIRDPFIVLAPDGFYYLTGTTTRMYDPREKGDKYNTGLGKTSIVGPELRVWKSRNLSNWQYVKTSYNVDSTMAMASRKREDIGEKNVLWAPEMFFDGQKWIMVHCPAQYSTLAVSEGNRFDGKWTYPAPDAFRGKHDASLFKDDDGSLYLVWGNTKLAKIKADLSGLETKPVDIGPSDRVIGHEGCLIKKIGSKYVLFGTGWSTDKMRKGSYNLYYCVSDNIEGPYGERRFVGRFLGHGTPFQDKQGQWWCTAFFNGNVPTISSEGIQSKDLRDNAYSINERGVTLVPLSVEIGDDGDVKIKALDPHYASPGPDEATLERH